MREPEETMDVGLKPLTLPQLFDEIFSLYRKNFMLFFGIAAVVFVPVSILTSFFVDDIDTMTATNQITMDDLVPILSQIGLLMVVTWITQMIATAALTKSVSERYLNRPSSIGSAFGFSLGRFFPYLLTLILVGLAFLVGIVVLLIPFLGWIAGPVLLIIFSFWFAFINPVFVVEGYTTSEAMGRSRELAKGNWGRIFLVSLVIVLLGGAVQLAVGTVSLLFFGEAITFTSSLVEGLLQGLASGFIIPIGLTGMILLYFDVRVREEGYDLELLAKDLEARSQSGTPLS